MHKQTASPTAVVSVVLLSGIATFTGMSTTLVVPTATVTTTT